MCLKLFKDVDTMKKHKVRDHRYHHSFKCNICKNSFDRPGQLAKHQFKVHGFHMRKELSTTKESKQLSKQVTVKDNKTKGQKEIVHTNCKYCGKSFSNPSNCKRHEITACSYNNTKNNNQPTTACKYCGKRFLTRSSCKRHEIMTCPYITRNKNQDSTEGKIVDKTSLKRVILMSTHTAIIITGSSK